MTAGPDAAISATSCVCSRALACGCPGSGAACGAAEAQSSTSNRWPRPSVPARTASVQSTPTLVARPGLQLRLAVTALRAGVLRYVTEDGTIVEADASTPAPGEAAGPVDLVDAVIASASVPLVFPPRPMADDDYVDGGVIEIVPVGAAVRLGAKRIIAVVAVPLGLPRDERDYAAASAGAIGLRALGMIGIADRQQANLGAPLPEGTSLITIDPVVDVVGLFEVEPGLLRINRDYGWLRAADALAEGDSDLLADVAASTHSLVEARCESWRLEEEVWERARSEEIATAGRLSLVREQKERVRAAVEQRKLLGFPVPDGCEAWWTEYEVHGRPRPAYLPARPTGSAPAA